jgi:hypothetical protein
MTHRLLGRIVLLCLVICVGMRASVYAQGPDEGQEPVVVAPSGQLSVTFGQFGYATMGLNRERETSYYNVRFSDSFKASPAGNYLDLVTYHLPEIPDKLSVLKVTVNGQLLSAFELTADNALSSTVRIDLPMGLLRTGSNWIRIDLDTSATCEDPGAIVDVFIDRSSTLSFGYQQNPYPTDLSFYPFPFVEESLLRIPVTLVLPDHPASDDLAAAATVAAGLGRVSGGAIDLTAAVASELSWSIQRDNHLIVIGQPEDNVLLNDLALPLPINSAGLEPGQGVLEEIVSPWNEFRLLLVVSGLDSEGVFKASQALNREARFLGMRGPVAVVTQLRPGSESVADRTSRMTLASLGYEDQIVYGALPQDYAFDFALPLGWQLQAAPVFVLRFSHAEILDPYGSAMDIVLNGVPIGSTLLDEGNVDEGELTISLPGHLLKPGGNRLGIGIEMNFPANSRDKCIDLRDQRAWTVISSESEIFLPYDPIDLPPDLSLFPYPFSQNLNQTVCVLPDQPSPLFLNDLMGLVVLLGSTSQLEYVSAHVAYASEVDQEARGNHHMILLGRPTENALLRAANAYLPQPFAPDSDVLEPFAVDDVAFLPDPERDAGLLEISESPWGEGYSLLAVAGTTDKGVQLAVQTLLDPSSRLKGNLAVVEPAFDPLSDDTNQITTYSIETRPSPALADRETSTYKDGMPVESDLALLAERWWK